jgi:hypothetical protein
LQGKPWEATLLHLNHTQTLDDINTATMQRGGIRDVRFAADDDDYEYERTSFTYRPLSRLPTPPPTLSKPSRADQSLEDDDTLSPRYRGKFLAAHLVLVSVKYSAAQSGHHSGWLHVLIRNTERGIRSNTTATLELALPHWIWANHMANSLGYRSRHPSRESDSRIGLAGERISALRPGHAIEGRPLH